VKKGIYKKISCSADYSHAENTDYGTNNQLYTQSMSYTVVVTSSAELGGENTCARDRAENSKIENEYKLVYYGNARHLLCTKRANHKVVKQVYQVCHRVLYYHWNGDGKSSSVKRLIAYIAFYAHDLPLFNISIA
jgi:hypothetical protein